LQPRKYYLNLPPFHWQRVKSVNHEERTTETTVNNPNKAQRRCEKGRHNNYGRKIKYYEGKIIEYK
jgi:hypothetical protein